MRKRERERGGSTERERERERGQDKTRQILYSTRVLNKHGCFFAFSPRPKRD